MIYKLRSGEWTVIMNQEKMSEIMALMKKNRVLKDEFYESGAD